MGLDQGTMEVGRLALMYYLRVYFSQKTYFFCKGQLLSRPCSSLVSIMALIQTELSFRKHPF